MSAQKLGRKTKAVLLALAQHPENRLCVTPGRCFLARVLESTAFVEMRAPPGLGGHLTAQLNALFRRRLAERDGDSYPARYRLTKSGQEAARDLL